MTYSQILALNHRLSCWILQSEASQNYNFSEMSFSVPVGSLSFSGFKIGRKKVLVKEPDDGKLCFSGWLLYKLWGDIWEIINTYYFIPLKRRLKEYILLFHSQEKERVVRPSEIHEWVRFAFRRVREEA